jgi:hypothetical protein
MYDGFWTLLGNNVNIVSTVPMLNAAVEDFGSSLATIHLKSNEVDTDTQGKAATKYQAEDDLIALLLPVAAGLFVYAKRQNKLELMEKARDTVLAGKAEIITSLAEENATNFAPAGIATQMITDLRVRVEAYRKALGEREKSVADRVGARTTIQDLFYQMDEILGEEIDPSMELVCATNTQFYYEYFTLQVVKDTGIRHRQGPVPAPQTAAVPVK